MSDRARAGRREPASCAPAGGRGIAPAPRPDSPEEAPLKSASISSPAQADRVSRAQSHAIARAEAHFGDDYFGRARYARYLSYFDQPGPILDFGCGTGVFLHFLRRHGRRGVGVDCDPRAIAEGRSYGLDVREADIFEFTQDPAQAGRYAGVMMADFIEHFDPHPCQQLLRQTADLLAPGGCLVIITPNSRCLMMLLGGFYESTIEHHNPYSIAAVQRFLEGCGLTTVAAGPEPASRLPIWNRSPLRMLRNVALWGAGRALCGATSRYEATFLVARKSAASAR